MRKKKEKIDGLSQSDKMRIRSALRKVWSWSYPRKLVVQRCVGKDGFHVCEKCGKKCPKVQIDHIVTVGDVDAGFIERLFCPSSGLRAWCHPCHRERTKAERKAARIKKMRF